MRSRISNNTPMDSRFSRRYKPLRLINSLAQQCYWSFKYHGLRGTLIGALAGATKPLKKALPFRKWCRRFKDQAFDLRFKVDTATCVSAEDLDISEDRRRNAVEYAATSPISFCQVISDLRIDYRNYSFVDLGSGKGRVLLLASHFPFREIVGVELASSLHQIAKKNIAGFAKRSKTRMSVSSVCQDVTTFAPPKGPTVFFLYNPFHGEVLESVLRNFQRSFEQSPRPMLIVYHNPVHSTVMDQLPCLSALPSDDEAWALYEFTSR